MHIHNVIKITFDSISRRIVPVLLMLTMSLVSLYLMDSVLTNYLKDKLWIDDITGTYQSVDNTYYIKFLNEYDYRGMDSFNTFYAEVNETNGVMHSGFYNLNRTHSKLLNSNNEAVRICRDLKRSYNNNATDCFLFGVMTADVDFMNIVNITYEEDRISSYFNKDTYIDANGNLPVYVGHAYKDAIPLGTVIDIQQDCNGIVVGYISEGQKWIVPEDPTGKSIIEDLSMDYLLLILREDHTMLYTSGMDVNTIYYQCDKENKAEVEKAIYEYAKEKDMFISIESITDNINDGLETNNLTNDNLRNSSVILIIMAAITISSSAIISCLNKRYEYGVMYAIGIKKREIIASLIIENAFILFLSFIMAYAIRMIQINRKYVTGIEMYDKSLLLAHNIYVPILLILLCIIMVIVTACIPAFIISKSNPIDLLYHND